MPRFVSVFHLLFLVLPAGLIFGAAPHPAAAEAVVTDVRVGEHGGMTRCVFDLTSQVTFNVFTLSDPERIVVDLPEVGWRLPGQPLPSRTGLLKTLRYGLHKTKNSRVVLYVNGPAAIARAFLVAPSAGHKYRLVIDLVATGGAAKQGNSPATGLWQASQPRFSAASPERAAAPFSPPLRKPMARKRQKKWVVAIDPGHGGVDPGTIGAKGMYEKHITLAVAREIKKRLERSGRFRVVLTRNRDIFIRLRDRVVIAREAGADLFMSIHADSIKNKNIRGLSVYTLSEKASDKEAAELAEQENKADLIAGVDLSNESPEVTNILIDLAQRETMNQSVHFASSLVGELKHKIRILRNSHRFAGFAVLKALDVPSVLIEVGFLSNRQDEQALRSKGYRAKLASSIERAIESYFAQIEEAYRK
ncbi:MAG TPA: N-acetylmuramoyl-L-alanine amidase [Rhodospirillales bacterium]|jgi:N-acetylmuramoyl-L-alanine amidase|nr:N-acetylmuramoyl-L-alanine amidase [Rhodospirillaceae bacterium]HJN22330.1 N-acetylmuramoyl-L-alanine amidase [Rhodospirillales bacterium]